MRDFTEKEANIYQASLKNIYKPIKAESDNDNIRDTIYRDAAIDALCNVCGNDCDKSLFRYDGTQEEQIIICPEHYVLSMLPSAELDRKTIQWIRIRDRGGYTTSYQCPICREYSQYETDRCPVCNTQLN